MDIKQAITFNLAACDFLAQTYLADITPAEMLARACPGANHLSWQIGHLIASERGIVEKAAPGRCAELPAGFAEKHKKPAAASDNPGDFLSKDEYLRIGKNVRAETLRVMNGLTPEEFDRPVPPGLPPFVKTTGEAFLFISAHWAMHAGQWVMIRRKLGRPPLF
jgi:hypothetical protein